MKKTEFLDEGWVSGFGRFRVVAGFSGYKPRHDEFIPFFHHATFYAKDDMVRDFLLIHSRCPSGRVVLSNTCEIPKSMIFSSN